MGVARFPGIPAAETKSRALRGSARLFDGQPAFGGGTGRRSGAFSAAAAGVGEKIGQAFLGVAGVGARSGADQRALIGLARGGTDRVDGRRQRRGFDLAGGLGGDWRGRQRAREARGIARLGLGDRDDAARVPIAVEMPAQLVDREDRAVVAGRSVLDRLAVLVEGGPLPWERYGDGFSTLVSASAPVFWLFFLLNGLAVIVQRIRDPARPRPFRVPGYPIPPLLFAATSGFMLYSSTNYARPLLPFVLIPVLAGIPLYGISQWLKQRQPVPVAVNRET